MQSERSTSRLAPSGPDSLSEPEATQQLLVENADLQRQLEEHQRREANFLILQETVLDLSNRRETGSVLRAIVRRARQFARSDFCYLSVLDEERGDFYALVNEGGVTPFFTTVRMEKSQGVLSKVINTRAPFFTSNYHEDDRFLHVASVDEAMRAEGIISILGIPLLIEDDILGVFFVADRRSRVYDPGEIAMLSSLAAHAALALESARLLEEARTANAASESRQSEIAAAAAAHDEMTDLVARGGSLEDLATFLAGFLQGRVTVLDPASRILCEAGEANAADPDRRPPDRVVRYGLTDARSAGRAVILDGWTNSRVAPVLGGGELLGGLMLDKSGPIAPGEIRTLERAAIVMGIVLLSQSQRLQRANREANELLAALFSEELVDKDIEAEAVQCGLAGESRMALLVVEGPSSRTGQGVDEVRAMLGSKSLLVGSHKGKIAAFVPNGADEVIAVDLMNQLRQAGMAGATIAVSRPIPRISAISGKYRTCIQMLRLASRIGVHDRVLTEDQLGLYAMMFDGQSSGDIRGFINSQIGPLLKRDKASSSDLVGTLLTYFDHAHSARIAAEVMKIHTNTLRQRLDTISSLLPNWNDPTRLFELHAALRLHNVYHSLG